MKIDILGVPFDNVTPDEATQVKSEDNKAVIYVEDANNVGNVINDIARNNNIRNIYTEKPQIEDIILKIYKSFNA